MIQILGKEILHKLVLIMTDNILVSKILYEVSIAHNKKLLITFFTGNSIPHIFYLKDFAVASLGTKINVKDHFWGQKCGFC